jgi:hypothetical protein
VLLMTGDVALEGIPVMLASTHWSEGAPTHPQQLECLIIGAGKHPGS